jgi:hypothetical protein
MYTIRERERESENEGNSEKYEKQYIWLDTEDTKISLIYIG